MHVTAAKASTATIFVVVVACQYLFCGKLNHMTVTCHELSVDTCIMTPSAKSSHVICFYHHHVIWQLKTGVIM